MKIECTNHFWDVVINIESMDWNDFMKMRSDSEEINMCVRTLKPSHTLICRDCSLIKQIND